uniref:Uncharacterized protein n=1 Tax=Meloidogyne hapla TaxID=6305 RepID=A0A1I8B1Y2_MELHA
MVWHLDTKDIEAITPIRAQGSNKMIRSRRALVSNSTSSASELLSSGRLEVLLRGLEDSLSPSNSTSSSSMRVMGTQKQQAVLSRLRHSFPLLQLIGKN